MMHILEVDGRRYAQFDRLRAKSGLAHAFSMRPDDVSVRLDGQTQQREARRRRMARNLGLDPVHLCCCVQIHETGLAVIDSDQPRGRIERADALVSDLTHIPLMCFSADCPLILAFDPVRRAVGIVHASWRCTVAGAAHRLVEAMLRRYGCDPAGMLAGIGPSAGPCCYEVGRDVYDAAVDLPNRDDLFPTSDGRIFFDLWRANREQLAAAGVPDAGIETAGICTMCRNDSYYSFRREGAGCGHFGLMAGLIDDGV